MELQRWLIRQACGYRETITTGHGPPLSEFMTIARVCVQAGLGPCTGMLRAKITSTGCETFSNREEALMFACELRDCLNRLHIPFQIRLVGNQTLSFDHAAKPRAYTMDQTPMELELCPQSVGVRYDKCKVYRGKSCEYYPYHALVRCIADRHAVGKVMCCLERSKGKLWKEFELDGEECAPVYCANKHNVVEEIRKKTNNRVDISCHYKSKIFRSEEVEEILSFCRKDRDQLPKSCKSGGYGKGREKTNFSVTCLYFCGELKI